MKKRPPRKLTVNQERTHAALQHHGGATVELGMTYRGQGFIHFRGPLTERNNVFGVQSRNTEADTRAVITFTARDVERLDYVGEVLDRINLKT